MISIIPILASESARAMDELITEFEVKEKQEAAQKGDVNAQYELGNMYFRGDGISKSYKKARFWLEKASEQNHVKAKELLEKLTKKEVSDRELEEFEMKLLKGVKVCTRWILYVLLLASTWYFLFN